MKSKEKKAIRADSFPPGKKERKSAKAQREKMQALFGKTVKGDKTESKVSLSHYCPSLFWDYSSNCCISIWQRKKKLYDADAKLDAVNAMDDMLRTNSDSTDSLTDTDDCSSSSDESSTSNPDLTSAGKVCINQLEELKYRGLKSSSIEQKESFTTRPFMLVPYLIMCQEIIFKNDMQEVVF